MSRSLTVVPEVSEGLIVDTQLKFIPMLHYAQSVPADIPGEQESTLVPSNTISPLISAYLES